MKVIKIIFFLFTLIIFGCSSIQKSIIKLESKYQYNAGFYLINPSNNKVLINYQGNRYFTPASNTKIYTLYAANYILPDSMPAFKYVKTDTALFLWGMADPSFLNPLLPYGNTFSFLASQPKLYISTSNFREKRLGLGWSWDDYDEGYSQEKTNFPIYGNSVHFNLNPISKELQIQPSIFKDSITIHQGKKYAITRNEFNNHFKVELNKCVNCEQLKPIFFSEKTLKKLLQDTLHIPVEIIEKPLPPYAKLHFSIPKDSVLKKMMQESDNFMAEHLLLATAGFFTDTLSTQIGIKIMNQTMSSFMPDKLIWKDGSGLSRYNLVTPRNTVALWQKLYTDMGEKRLFSLISAGGKKGTLKKWFKAKKPYIYGKTGTLSNVFSLSGFLIAKSGKRLIFSYMNNNYPVSSSNIKKEMEIILKNIYEKY